MFSVLAAEWAVLHALQTVRCILLVLDREVVSLLAFFAPKNYFYSCVSSHVIGTSYFIYPLCGHCLPDWDADFLREKRAKIKPLVRQVISNIAHPPREVNIFLKYPYILYNVRKRPGF
jgi:hypothetical protein